LVVNVSWACIAAGSVRNNNSGNSLAAQAVLKRPVSVFELVVVAKEF
jgi:hypothetical protein